MRCLKGFLFIFAALALAAPEASDPAQPRVRYKAGKDLNFEEILIEGQLQRPEVSVVTGQEEQDTNGLLRLREDFADRMAIDFGEAIP